MNPSNAVMQESLANIGATIMGRNMFGGHHGGWDSEKPWNGWWGDDPPFHHLVFVLTHHPRPKLELKGGNSFTFVTDGIESASSGWRSTNHFIPHRRHGGAGSAPAH